MRVWWEGQHAHDLADLVQLAPFGLTEVLSRVSRKHFRSSEFAFLPSRIYVRHTPEPQDQVSPTSCDLGQGLPRLSSARAPSSRGTGRGTRLEAPSTEPHAENTQSQWPKPFQVTLVDMN